MQSTVWWPLLSIINVTVDLKEQETFSIAKAVLYITTGEKSQTEIMQHV